MKKEMQIQKVEKSSQELAFLRVNSPGLEWDEDDLLASEWTTRQAKLDAVRKPVETGKRKPVKRYIKKAGATTKKEINEVGHGKGTQSAFIDALLRRGATMAAMVSGLISSGLSVRTEKITRLRVYRHLSHLQVDDGYEVRRDDKGVYTLIML